jgi:hypothetical protein
VRRIEICDQPGLLRLPAQPFPSPLAGGREVTRRKWREQTEMPGRFLRRLADYGHVQVATDDLGYLSEPQPFFGDSVISASCGTLLQRQPVKMCGIEPVHCGPAVAPIPYIAGDAFLARQIDEDWNEAVIAIAVD